MAVRIVAFCGHGLVVRTRRNDRFTITYGEILTAERLSAPRRGIRLHTLTTDGVTIACDGRRLAIESELRQQGVRVVDRWGCIIAPTLAEFEAELRNKPARLRQSSDDARSQPPSG